MSEFPRVNLPDVTDEQREMIQEIKDRQAFEDSVKQRNLEGMALALLRKGMALPRKKRNA